MRDKIAVLAAPLTVTLVLALGALVTVTPDTLASAPPLAWSFFKKPLAPVVSLRKVFSVVAPDVAADALATLTLKLTLIPERLVAATAFTSYTSAALTPVMPAAITDLKFAFAVASN